MIIVIFEIIKQKMRIIIFEFMKLNYYIYLKFEIDWIKNENKIK